MGLFNFYTSRNRYWSCSKLANFIRGEKKPYALTLEEWDQWEKKMREERPNRYWLSDKFLNRVQDFLLFPWDLWKEIKHWYNIRYLRKTHVLDTGLKPGKYHDLDYRILHACFNEFCKYVDERRKYVRVEEELDELYDWWKETYLQRDDPWETITKETHGDKYYEVIREEEKKRWEEEQEMLVRLIKVRDKLWI
jgi:hypothetical protein